jgi:hypothetical protein
MPEIPRALEKKQALLEKTIGEFSEFTNLKKLSNL